MEFHLFIFPCYAFAFGVRSEINIAKTDVKELTAYVFSYNFMVLGLKFNSLIYNEIIYVYDV